jgi:ATP-dependent DNA ligase
MRLVRRPRPFDDADWIFEVKLDGFRAGKPPVSN